MGNTQAIKDRTLRGFRFADNLSPGCFEKRLCSGEKRLNEKRESQMRALWKKL
jgi:hypothetical protein